MRDSWLSPAFEARDLSEDESAQLWRQLETKWGIDRDGVGYWYPIDGPNRTDLLAVEAFPFLAEVDVSDLRAILRDHHVASVFELQLWPVDRPDRELPLNQWAVVSDTLEYYWFSESADWIIYSSHEESITFGGARLQNAVKKMWPRWSASIWQTPRSE